MPIQKSNRIGFVNSLPLQLSFLGSARAIRNQGWPLVSMSHLWLGTRDFTSIYGGLLWMIGRWTFGVLIASASTGVDGWNAMRTPNVVRPIHSYRHPKIDSFLRAKRRVKYLIVRAGTRVVRKFGTVSARFARLKSTHMVRYVSYRNSSQCGGASGRMEQALGYI